MLNTWQGRRSVGGTSEVWSLCSGVHCCEDFPPYILCPSRFLCPFCKRCTWEESLRETVVKLIVFICQSLNRSSQLYAGSGLVHINTTQRPLNHTGYTWCRLTRCIPDRRSSDLPGESCGLPSFPSLLPALWTPWTALVPERGRCVYCDEGLECVFIEFFSLYPSVHFVFSCLWGYGGLRVHLGVTFGMEKCLYSV